MRMLASAHRLRASGESIGYALAAGTRAPAQALFDGATLPLVAP